MAEIFDPREIEKKSFEIITQRLNGKVFDGGRDSVIKRVIHTTADFEYADNLVFGGDATDVIKRTLKGGCCIVTDTNMALQGINKKWLNEWGCKVKCFMSDDDVARKAKERGITRAMVSMEKACEIKEKMILAVGNAPTALMAADKLIKEGKMRPEAIIAVPVGFVNVIESKELIINGSVPFIAARGNKGGSTVAAAICNALIYDAAEGK
ncbi:MAG: precorrin-8X methylmutase [Firmicutes bacterium]|nr:precorrin-8X methylmutase [Bacillota bacterium]